VHFKFKSLQSRMKEVEIGVVRIVECHELKS
jgi:hypothetical protein